MRSSCVNKINHFDLVFLIHCLLVRVMGRDLTTNSGLLRKGSICSLQFLVMFRNAVIFEEPDLYLPSRWENPSPEMRDAFTPFSIGKQNCLGQTLAKAETMIIIARILSEFELTVECEGTSEVSLTLKPVGVRLKARKII